MVTGTDPLTLWFDNAYSGSPDDYRTYLTRVRWHVVPLSLILLLNGAELIAYGMRRLNTPLRIS